MSLNIQYLWKDRNRYFGMPISFTRYAMSEDRLFTSVVFLNLKDDEVLLYRVRDIDTNRTLWQRLFGVGTVTVMSSDKTMPTLVMKNIKRPLEVKELLHSQVEEMKIRRRVRVGEVLSANYDDDRDDHGRDNRNHSVHRVRDGVRDGDAPIPPDPSLRRHFPAWHPAAGRRSVRARA